MRFIDCLLLDAGVSEPKRGMRRPEKQRASSRSVSEGELRDALEDVLAAAGGPQRGRPSIVKEQVLRERSGRYSSNFGDSRYKEPNSHTSKDACSKDSGRQRVSRKPDWGSADPAGRDDVQGNGQNSPPGEARDWHADSCTQVWV